MLMAATQATTRAYDAGCGIDLDADVGEGFGPMTEPACRSSPRPLGHGAGSASSW
jgi:hypothetical protein